MIGVVGTIGSGKGVVCRYLKEKYRFRVVTMSNILRALARKNKIRISRESLQRIQDKYHEKYGLDYLINLAIKKIKKSKNAAIDGIRTPTQVQVAKKAGAKIIFVDAKPEIRFERLKERRRKGFPKTLKEFKKDEINEWRHFNFKKTFSYADFKINNDGNEKQLFAQVDKIIKTLS